jgi:hypothetical protein
MTVSLPAWMVPSCDQVPALAAAYGALSRLTWLDMVFQPLGAPPIVHWGLSGGLANYQCKGVITADKDMAMAMFWGFAGGGAVHAMLRGPPM